MDSLPRLETCRFGKEEGLAETESYGWSRCVTGAWAVSKRPCGLKLHFLACNRILPKNGWKREPFEYHESFHMTPRAEPLIHSCVAKCCEALKIFHEFSMLCMPLFILQSSTTFKFSSLHNCSYAPGMCVDSPLEWVGLVSKKHLAEPLAEIRWFAWESVTGRISDMIAYS